MLRRVLVALAIYWLGVVTLRVAQTQLGSSDFRLLLTVVLVPAVVTAVVVFTSETFKRLFSSEDG